MLTSPGNDAECLLLRLPLFTCEEKFGVLGSWALASTAMSPKSDPDWQDLVSANARDKLWEGARAAAAGFSEALGCGSEPLWTAKCHHKWELSVRKPGCGRGRGCQARQGGVKPTLPEHSGRSRRWGREGERVEYSFKTRPMVSKSHGHGPEGLLLETIIGGH